MLYCLLNAGMTIYHTSTRGFLNMKEALGKYGGSSLGTAVNIFLLLLLIIFKDCYTSYENNSIAGINYTIL